MCDEISTTLEIRETSETISIGESRMREGRKIRITKENEKSFSAVMMTFCCFKIRVGASDRRYFTEPPTKVISEIT